MITTYETHENARKSLYRGTPPVYSGFRIKHYPMRLTKNITPASLARINAQLAKFPRTLSNTGENWYTTIHTN